MSGSPLNPIPTPPYNSNDWGNQPAPTPRGMMYNDPQGLRGTPVPSSGGDLDVVKQAFSAKAFEIKLQYQRIFSKLGNVITLPKNSGQMIRRTVHVPVLTGANVNDQGIDARGVQIRNGNLYGSSTDILNITNHFPVIGEGVGKANRIGMTAYEVTGTINRFGIMMEWSDYIEMFHVDPDYVSRKRRQLIEAAELIHEDQHQVDLLCNAGLVIYAGNATSDETVDENCMATQNTIKVLANALDQVDCPEETHILSGSPNFNTTPTVYNRMLYVGTEVASMIQEMPEFTKVEQYAANMKTVSAGEIGIIHGFRVIKVKRMFKWEGAGAEAKPNMLLGSSKGRYNIYPMLVVGSGSFSSINFAGMRGTNGPFKIIEKGPDEAASLSSPYGGFGFTSIQWFYGILIERPEWIGVIKTVARPF